MNHIYKKALALAIIVSATTGMSLSAAPPKTGGEQRITLREAFAVPQRPHAAKVQIIPGTGTTSVLNEPTRSTAGASCPVLYACMMDNNTWPSKKAYGMYSFSPSEYSFTQLKQNSDFNVNGGAAYIGTDNYLLVNYADFGDGLPWGSLTAYETNNWSKVYSTSFEDWTCISTDLAWCSVDNMTYGCFYNSDNTGRIFGKFDPDQFETTKICDLDEGWIACGCDAQGNIYAVTKSGKLVKVDRSSGSMTEVGNTGLTSDRETSGAIDPSTGIFYVAVWKSDGASLYSVNTTTAAATKLYDMEHGEQLRGMYVATPALSTKAPGAVTNLAAIFEENSLEGTVNFTAPTITVGGTPGSGPLSYTISTAEREIASGMTTYGANESVPVELPAAGTYELSVAVSNADGTGPAASVTVTVTSQEDPDNLVSLPYLEDFSTKAGFDTYTVINRNQGDPYTFTYWSNRGCALCQFDFSGQASDDYLITPPVRLEKGKIYVFSVDTYTRPGDKQYKEKFELLMGNEPTAESLTTVLQPTIEIADDQVHTSSLEVSPEKSGIYYFAIHCVSDKNEYGLCVDNVSVSTGSSATAPAAPTLEVENDYTGATSATISVLPPSEAIDGTALSALKSVVVLRDGETIHTFENPPANQVLRWQDSPQEAGYHNYTAYAVNADGEGRRCERRAYVGINYPAVPRNVTMVEDGNTGKVTIKWDAPESDCDGNKLNPLLVTYMVMSYNKGIQHVEARGLTDTQFSMQALDPEKEEQRFVTYMVFSETAKGVNDWQITYTPTIPVGKPFATPYRETFGGEKLSPMITTSTATESKWGISSIVDDQDGDGKFLMYVPYTGDTGTLSTGKVHLGDTKPSLSFWYMCLEDNDSPLEVSINTGSGFVPLATVNLSHGTDQKWAKYEQSLDNFAGKDIQLKFSYTGRGYSLALDNLIITNPMPVDLEALSLSLPIVVHPGVPFKVQAKVCNNGSQPSEKFTADLYRDNVKVSSLDYDAVPEFGNLTVAFDQTLPAISESKINYYIALNSDNDAEPTNNVTLTGTVDLVQNDYPTASNLTAAVESTHTAIELKWDAPVKDTTPVVVNDDVEGYTAFSSGLPTSQVKDDNVGDWTMVNADGCPTYLIAIDGVPYYFPNAASTTSFVVLNASMAELPDHWKGRNDSEQCFMAMSATGAQSDKWLISPRLSGNSQTIKFFAKSVKDSWGLESFEVLYSTKGKDVKDFVTIGAENGTVPTDWTEYSYDLPEGATYFALRHVSNDIYALLADDFTFEAASAESLLELKGYNIYRDGANLNDNPVTSPAHVDTTAEPGSHTYMVTALYATGESAPSNAATVTLSDIEAPSVSSALVGTEAGGILIWNARGEKVTIYATDGRTVFSAELTGDTRISVSAGVYLVETADRTVKVVVR